MSSNPGLGVLGSEGTTSPIFDSTVLITVPMSANPCSNSSCFEYGTTTSPNPVLILTSFIGTSRFRELGYDLVRHPDFSRMRKSILSWRRTVEVLLVLFVTQISHWIV